MLLLKFRKQPSEETTRAVDFGNTFELQNGETIQSTVVTVTQDGTVVTGDILVSSSIEDSRVLFRVRGGEHKKTYKITVVMTTDTAHIREADIFMEVVEV